MPLPLQQAVHLRYDFMINEEVHYLAMVRVSGDSVRLSEFVQALEILNISKSDEITMKVTTVAAKLPAGAEPFKPVIATLVITPRGKILSSNVPLEPRPLLLPELSEVDVAVGGTWSTEAKSPERDGAPKIRTLYQLESPATLFPGSAQPLAAVRMSYTCTGLDFVFKIDPSSSGKLWFDTRQGRLVRQLSTLVMTGPAGTLKFEQDLELIRPH